MTRYILSPIAVEGHAAASTQNQALAALLFLYRHVLGIQAPWVGDFVRAPQTRCLPVVLTRDEVGRLFSFMEGAPRLMAQILYGSGLRLLECCHLRVKDFDFAAGEITVRQGKGDKDRRTMLPGFVADELRAQLRRVRELHARDLTRGAGFVELPQALSRKFPAAGRDWNWQWVLPATRH